MHFYPYPYQQSVCHIPLHFEYFMWKIIKVHWWGLNKKTLLLSVVLLGKRKYLYGCLNAQYNLNWRNKMGAKKQDWRERTIIFFVGSPCFNYLSGAGVRIEVDLELMNHFKSFFAKQWVEVRLILPCERQIQIQSFVRLC